MMLKNIYFGKVDAKNELLENTPDQRKNFVSTFLLPNNFNIDNFYEGKRYYVYGLKGTGKTAFLRYLSIYLEDKYDEVHTSFVLFKSEFGEDEKQSFSKAANVFLDQDQFKDYEKEQDFEPIWKWFFYRHIIEFAEEKKVQFFECDDKWDKFIKHVKSLKLDAGVSGLGRFIPTIKKGEVELNIGAGKLGLDFVFDQERTTVKFTQLQKIAEKYFEKLTPTNTRLYIFLDELELAYNTTKTYSRDSRLIRDLVVVINKMNTFCRQRNYPLYFVSAVRSEVLTAVESTGKEINKAIEDFGTLITWHQAGGDLRNHPLIEIILKRLQVAEQKNGTTVSYPELWKKYFPFTIQNKRSEEYILFNSWYRPRDIVRMLTLAQETFANEETLGHNVFDGIRKTYSSRSWTEALEELRAIYSDKDLEALYSILCGWKRYFSEGIFIARIEDKVKGEPEIESLRKKGSKRILKDLYHAGIIGNRYFDENGIQRFRFTFRGDEHLLLDKGMMIHHALVPYLSL